jgi:hypothetical protein
MKSKLKQAANARLLDPQRRRFLATFKGSFFRFKRLI